VERGAWLLCGTNGLLAVALGAFGAHGLKTRLASLSDVAQRLDWWQTAAHYQLAHALAIGLCAQLLARSPGRPATFAVACFGAGIALFSGSLYAMTLTGLRALGAVTPLGGLLLLCGWLSLIAAALKLEPT